MPSGIPQFEQKWIKQFFSACGLSAILFGNHYRFCDSTHSTSGFSRVFGDKLLGDVSNSVLRVEKMTAEGLSAKLS
jgi:hypothetical protein